MNLFGCSLTGPAYWKIHRDDPELLELNSLPGWVFVNPLVYPRLTWRFDILVRPMLVVDDVAILETSGMVLGTTKEQYSIDLVPFPLEGLEIGRAGTSDDEIDDLRIVVPAYLNHLAASLRQASKQFKFPTGWLGFSETEVSDLPSPRFPTADPNSEHWVVKYIWDTAVTWEQLIEADMRLIASITPVHEELLLDAIHAFYDNDYRRSLLYSAISIETIAATKLEEIYEAALHSEDHEHKLRIIQRAQAKGSFVLKDPIYEFLAARGKFAELLHHLPLYLMGKSLLIENEQLYQKAIELYKTRNKIAHLGDSSAKGPAGFGANEEDTRSALQIVLDIFRWFGNDTKFPLYGPGFDSIKGFTGTLD